MSERNDIRVLIVEDDYFVAASVRGAVLTLGYSVAGEAANGHEAVAMTESLQPDVVLMDIRMPDMDGIEAAGLIQDCCPTPIVVLTAYQDEKLVEQAATAGVSAYLVKPPDPAQIDRAIAIARSRFQDMMELRRLNAELQAALEEVKLLSGLLPICASCKKIRDDEGYWHQVEEYIETHSEAEFTHGLCPSCIEKYFPGYSHRTDNKE